MIHFMKFKTQYFLFSGIFLLIGIFSLIVWGLKPSIDFTGGALLEVSFDDAQADIDVSGVSQTVSSIENIGANSVQFIKDNRNYVIRTNSIGENQKNEILTALEAKYSKPEEIKFETVGPTLGKELLVKTAIAIAIAAILILFYVAYQFKDKWYGLAAILAMFHDSIILVGAFALLGKLFNVEVDTLFVTALLTTLSFSVHDTIVVFDRIRELLRLRPSAKLEDVINEAVTETLSRSLNNSMTIIFMLTALALLGGSTIKWFVVALLIGTISGTYSSTFTAAPLLLILDKWKSKSKAK